MFLREVYEPAITISICDRKQARRLGCLSFIYCETENRDVILYVKAGSTRCLSSFAQSYELYDTYRAYTLLPLLLTDLDRNLLFPLKET